MEQSAAGLPERTLFRREEFLARDVFMMLQRAVKRFLEWTYDEELEGSRVRERQRTEMQNLANAVVMQIMEDMLAGEPERAIEMDIGPMASRLTQADIDAIRGNL